MNILNRKQNVVPTPEAINELKKQSARLDQVQSNLRMRDKILFEQTAKAIQRSDKIRARIYANELNRIRQLKQVIAQSQLAIECIAIRLENFLDLYNIVTELKPITQVVKEVSSDVSKVLPQVASELEQLNSIASETLMNTSVNFNQSSLDFAFQTNNESEDILNEVSNLIENNLHSSFPEPPIKSTSRVSKAPLFEAISYESNYSSDPYTLEDRNTKTKDNIQNWKLFSDDVAKMLDDLSKKGQLKMEEVIA
ncbi:Snf7 family protein [Candidatus Bathyarchaeota archaeon]|nr:Snf7 family protein [Candidatus Bathyarchaeota archaeon]